MFHGHFIPAGTTVLMNLYSINYDPKVFEDPEKFNVHRFLNKQGDYEPRNADHVIAFGYGKRKCVGKMEPDRNILW